MQNHVVSEEVIPLCVGQFVACKLKKFEDEKPQFGQVISLLDGGKIVIEWWVGSYSSMWVKWKIRGVTQVEEMAVHSILKNRINLTKTNRLTKTDVQELKMLYTAAIFV